MKAGDLVTWTEQWLGTCMSTDRTAVPYNNLTLPTKTKVVDADVR